MAYIGRQLARGENKLFDDISSSFNGSTTTFNLTVSSVATATATAYQLFVSLGGVMQKPNTDFTTAGNQITFTTAPAAGLSCWIMMQGDTIDQAAIPDASVSPSKIAGSGDFAFPADVRLKDGDGSHYVGFQAPTTVSTNKIWTLPAADGSANQYLKTDGSGTLSWGSDSATDSTKMPLAGGTFTGNTIYNDNIKSIFGTGSDFQIYHNGSNNIISSSNGQIQLLKGTSETLATFGLDGAVELYYDGGKTLETTANGVTIFDDGKDDEARLIVQGGEGNGATIFLHADDGDDNADKWRIGADTSGNFKVANYSTGSWVDGLTFDGSNNATFAGDIKMAAVAGTANVLRIPGHDGSSATTGCEINHQSGNFQVTNTVGNTYFQANGQFRLRSKHSGSTEEMLIANVGGAVELYYDNVKKYETSAAGSKFTGGIAQVATAVAALDLDLNTSNYFTKTISGNSTFTFSNPAASGTVSIFMLELTHSSGTVTWPGTVKWNEDTAPTLTTGKTHLFMFVTDDNGSRYRGSSLVDYVN